MKTFKMFRASLGLITLLACGFTASPAGAVGSSWSTDLPAAVKKAKAENKMVLINFTGSDWCPWCFKLRDEVFAMPEFATYADANLVLVVADFPQNVPQPASLKAANQALARKYGITGYPTVIILDKDEKQVAKLGYMPGGPRTFISQIPGSKSAAVASNNAGNVPGVPSAPAAPTVPPPPPALPAELTLKAILGGKKNPLVIINNKTLGIGEEARVKLADREVKIRCEKITDDSVALTVDGVLKELHLKSGQ